MPVEPRVIAITGATDGLGQATAMKLAGEGHTLLLHGRNPAKGAALLERLTREQPDATCHYLNADLASLAEVVTLSEQITTLASRLDVLINNAGVGPISEDSPRRLSQDGHELFFAVNYLAGVLLTRRLLPLLQTSQPARIINIASIGQQPLDFSNLMLERDYDDARAYRQSKLAQILFTFSLAEQLSHSAVTVNCLHPATLMDTAMVKDSASFPGARSTLDEGVQALLNLVSNPALATSTGQYFEGLNPARANEQAYDPAARTQLADITNNLLRPWL